MLDRRGELLRQSPAAGHHAADERVVDAELAALGVDALLGRARGRVDLARVAGVGLHQHELADVVQQRGDQQLVAVGELDPRAEPVGGALRRDRVQAEALGRCVPQRACARRSRRSWWRRSALRRRPGVSTSIASGMLRTRPRPSACLFASRMTAITSATSDSIAATISLTDGWSWLTSRSTRLRDSASAGNASSASNAAVSRRPWPSLCWLAGRQRGRRRRPLRGPRLPFRLPAGSCFPAAVLPSPTHVSAATAQELTARRSAWRARASQRGVDPRAATHPGPAGPGSRRSRPRRSAR